MLSEFLLESGYQPESAFSGTDGLRKLKEHCYDLVLLDLMLPYKSGDQVLRELREFSDIPVIVISAKDLVGTKIDLLKLGADDYITVSYTHLDVYKRQDLEWESQSGPKNYWKRFYSVERNLFCWMPTA